MSTEDQDAKRRLLAKVEPIPIVGCWLWTGSVNPDGYGNFSYKGWSQKAHRIAYELFVGAVPDGLFVCHRCDVPGCVNPNHLFIGTNKDNVHDMLAKGRSPILGKLPPPVTCGEANIRSKLTAEKVREIRASTDSNVVLGRRYGVSGVAISKIKRKKMWAHV